jgi:hypothetical protein
MRKKDYSIFEKTIINVTNVNPKTDFYKKLKIKN